MNPQQPQRASALTWLRNSVASVLLLAAAATQAQEWPHWRGPNYNGSGARQKLPTTFSKTEGVAWKAPMPGDAASTPVVFGDRVFVSSADAETRGILALCLDRRTGKELWRHKVVEIDRRDERSNFASPSPITDGKYVWFFFGQGELIAYTMDGKEVWRRNIQKDHGDFAFQWTFASTPLLHEGRLYLQVLQRNVPVNRRRRGPQVQEEDKPIESYILAMNPETGEDLWRHVRPSEARAESLEAFTSPVPFEHEGRKEILVAGGDCITGHDPETGRELWRWGTWNPTRITHWRLVPSPVAGAGMVLACAPKGAPIYAIKAGQSGTLPDSGYAWKSSGLLSTDVSTPLFYRGRFYVVNSDEKLIMCVDPATGNVIWEGGLTDRHSPKIEGSPTAADGKIYVMNFKGDVFVIGTGDKFELLHTAAMGDEDDDTTRSSIAIAHGQLFIRTAKMLYAIGPAS